MSTPASLLRIVLVCAAGLLALDAFAQEGGAGAARPVAFPNVVITGAYSNGDPLPQEGGVVLPRGSRDIEVRYRVEGVAPTDTALFQVRMGGDMFEIRRGGAMEGAEALWTNVGGQTTAYYTDLPPGHHLFHVRAYDARGRWETQTELPILVRPYFYETRWFTVLALIALALLLGGVAWWRVREVRTRAERLDRLVSDRTREIEEARRRTEEALARAERERATTEEALATVEDQALQLLRMDHMKSRLFANLSHEFRTPLTLILDPLDRALKGEGLDADLRRSLDQARLNALRILQLINQVLDLAKIEAGSMELHTQEADLIPFLRQTTDLFDSEAERLGITLQFRAAAVSIPAYFDPDKLEKVVFNLMSNALKATPRGGKVLVSAREVPDAAGGPGQAEITMRDTGVGIAEENLPLIFDRFFQGEAGRMKGGSGIGLALVKELVEMHGGEIRVESTQGFGSTFTVCLPLGRSHLGDHEVVAAGASEEGGAVEGGGATEAGGGYAPLEAQVELAVAPTDPPAASSPHPHSGDGADGRPLVLVVEDNADIRRMICSHLQARYRVAEAADGEEGLRVARERHPDLVLTDLFMPHLNGLELCRRLKRDERLASTPVILLTAHASDESRLEGLQTGADDFLTKPFSPDELLMRVENLIRSREALRDQYSQEVLIRPLGVTVPSADAAFMERVYGAVAEHLADEAFTVPALASEVGVSESQLKRKLKAIAGESPVAFIRNRRLERAAELLRARVGTVGEVCTAVGFGSASYFARRFKKRFGVTPSDYADQEEAQQER